MYYITTSPFGVFATADHNNIAASVYFSKDPKIAKKQYTDSLKIILSKEESELMKKLKSEEFIFEIKKDTSKHQFPNPAGTYVRSNMFRLAEKNKFTSEEFNDYLYRFNLELTADVMRNQKTDDKLIIQAVSAIDDLDKTINVMCMRLREWYGLYFPEAGERISDNEKYARYVSETLYRTDVNSINIEETIGSEMKPIDLEEQKIFAQSIVNLFAERKNLEKYINKKCAEVIPNMTAIIGAEQASRILAHAGSTVKLAKFPSSTIQILGAEKALFRYLHNIGTSPKHGIIFNTGYIQKTPKEHRGKVARILASKLSIASKIDNFKGEYSGDRLRAEMDKAFEHVMKSKPKTKIKKEKTFNKDVSSNKENNFNRDRSFNKNKSFTKETKFNKDVSFNKEKSFTREPRFNKDKKFNKEKTRDGPPSFNKKFNKEQNNRTKPSESNSPVTKESTAPKSGGFEQYLKDRQTSPQKPRRRDPFRKFKKNKHKRR